VNANATVVRDVAEFPETVHEVADAGPCRSDHIRERLLSNCRYKRLRFAGFTKLRHEKKGSRQPLFTGIEELIDQVFLGSDTADEDKFHEHLREASLLLEYTKHSGAFDLHCCTRRYCSCR